ncbi:YraN family protein [Candidatus Uhrbacteria bacterium]|nr:YraN family protein [Candidatus Uhrbacteria bacterium]
MASAKSIVGQIGEQAACDFLYKKGYNILQRNYRVPGGEIDIIVRDKGEIIFVEVKARSSTIYGHPEESVHFVKQKKMARAIRSYLLRYTSDPPFRIDIIAVIISMNKVQQVHHIPNIFFEFEI